VPVYPGALCPETSADELPLPDASQRSLLASLGDPYNDQNFWKEVARVLQPGGQALFTTPSFEWANRFRASLPTPFQSAAQFITAEGRKVWIPSRIFTEEVQKDLIESAGLKLLELRGVSLSKVPPPISRKLALLEDGDKTILTGYLTERGAT
jgi:SAM-dependent methyltransferase